jgi:adenine-specific DNA-methyltransferase
LKCEIIQGDTLEELSKLPSESVRLVVSSPPYNIGKDYEEQTSVAQYLEWMSEVVAETLRVLMPGGSIAWQVGNYVEDGHITPLDYHFWDMFARFHLKLRNRIVWRFGHGLHCSKRFSGRYEMILWVTKGDDYLFNLDPVRVPQKYPGKKHFKGPKKGQLSGNPLGCNPGDTWEFVAKEWDTQVWDIPNVKSNHPEKTDHPCQFPVELVERCVLALSDEGETVLDPFGGVGTVAVACKLHNRKGVCIEREPGYVEIARGRLDDLERGRLRIRPMGRPIHVPKDP